MSELALGELVVGRYRLTAELGDGGMGVVFRARDEVLGRDVAVKVLRSTNVDTSRRLQREARATGELDPARVARVHEVGETPSGQAFLVMEYVEGRTLRSILSDTGISRPEALRILRELGITLDHAHAAGLLHRDVKPDNVMVCPDGRVVLLDFGIVKHLDRSDDVAHVTTQLTSEGTMIGTPAYLAPEQALGRDVGPAVDQFALAVTAFELLAGKLPWTATDATRMLAQILAEAPPSVSTLNGRVPRPFDAVLARALSKLPEGRFPTVSAFTDALDAAERGDPPASPASLTVEGPASAITPPTAPAAVAAPRRLSIVPALLAGVLLVGGGATLLRIRWPLARPDSARPRVAPALVVTTRAPLACPIFAVEGVPGISPELGAAASSLVCQRAKWFLGGSDEQVLVPAALLHAPTEPRHDLPDFFGDPNARASTLEAARTNHLPTLDGTLVRGHDSWRVDLVARDPTGADVARVSSVEAPYLEAAIRDAVTRLWHTSPLEPQPIDPEVARWTAYPDIEAGLLEADATQGGGDEACEAIRRRGPELGLAYYYLGGFCGASTPLLDGGAAPRLDESSGPALVTTGYAILGMASEDPFSDPETQRIALKLESMAASEPSRFGRAALSRLAGVLWTTNNEVDRAYATFLSSLGNDPLVINAWHYLVATARGAGSAGAARSIASVWFPQEPAFLPYASVSESDVLDGRLRDAQLAYLLEPTAGHTLTLGETLAEAGRAEEVRALIASVPINRSAPDPDVTSALLGFIDLHDAMFGRALARLEGGGSAGVVPLLPLADVLGRVGATASEWATSFLKTPDKDAVPLTTHVATLGLCMNAGGTLAKSCLTRVERLAGPDNAWGVGGDLMLRGAKRFAAGDVKGAVEIWRPIVANANDDLAPLLPTAAFERAGEPDLAARIDARKMKYRQFAGVSEAAPREAWRAFRRGDRARAKELASAVLHAWEVADVPIPAVADMRTLLSKIGD